MYLTREQVEKIPEMLKEGQTQGDISIYYGTSLTCINRWVRVLRERGVKIPTKMGRPSIFSRVKEPPCQTQQN
jgi:uncharacterized protein YerC